MMAKEKPPDYYTVIAGKRDGKRRRHNIRSPDKETAIKVKENFDKRVNNTKSTKELMQEHGWSDMRVLGIKEVEE